MALAFDPETRATRLTYLVSRMSVFVYRGASVDEDHSKFAESQGEPPDTLDNRKVALSPADTERLLGANQAAAKCWTRSWQRDDHRELVVVVRNTNRWATLDRRQPYGLAVLLPPSLGTPVARSATPLLRLLSWSGALYRDEASSSEHQA